MYSSIPANSRISGKAPSGYVTFFCSIVMESEISPLVLRCRTE